MKLLNSPGPATFTIPEAATRLGIGRNTAYDEVKRTGRLVGIPVMRVGRRIVVSKSLLERRLLGETLPGDARAGYP